MTYLTDDFKKSEFACKCGCGFDDVNDGFVNRLQFARNIACVPFVITSGCRCKSHNKAEGGGDSSDHLTGEGADIKAVDSATRFKIVNAAISAGFNRIGIGKTFVHLGSNPNNPKGVCWLYG